MMKDNAIKELQKNAGPAIKYRLNREILNKPEEFEKYLPGILEDKRIQYVLSWQKSDGYFGEVFHGGWIPKEKRKYSTTGAESALRFLAEMGFSKEYPPIAQGLNVLLDAHWNRGSSSWNIYQPEIGLFGDDLIRAVAFGYFRIDDHLFIQQEIQRAFECLEKLQQIQSVHQIIEKYRDKNVYKPGIILPWSYHLKLLALTQSWRTESSQRQLAEWMGHLIGLSPFPDIYIKYKSQLIAPARIFPNDLKKSLKDFRDQDWFWWFHTFELFARMGIVAEVPILTRQLEELQEILHQGNGFFPVKPKDACFHKWSVYSGLALEEDWKKDKWRYDLTFRSLLILKYAGKIL